MRRLAPLALLVLFAVGCSSDESKTPEPAPAPAPAKAVDAAPPSPEVACAAGDVDACVAAEKYGVACLHGHGESCAKHGEANPKQRGVYLARACRRGYKAACDEELEPIKVAMSSATIGPVAERLDTVYRHAVVDCFVELDETGEVAVTLSADGSEVKRAVAGQAEVARCVKDSLATWNLGGLEIPPGDHVFAFARQPPPVVDKGPSDAEIQEAIANTALIEVLTAGDENTAVLSDRDVGASLDKAISDVKNSGDGKIGVGSGRVGADTGPVIPDETPKSRVNVGAADDLDETSLEPASVLNRIRRRYIMGLKRCHQRLLKTDKTAGGRVRLRFRVGTTGRVVNASAKGFDATVDACISAQMKKWRFGVPKDDAGSPTTAQFALKIVMKPR